MIHQGKCRAAKDLIEKGIEVEELMEQKTVYGSDEWEQANEYLQYVYNQLGALFMIVRREQ